MSQMNRTLLQLIVLLPTLALSAVLGHTGVALVPRLVFSLGFGMMLIAAVAAWQRKRNG